VVQYSVLWKFKMRVLVTGASSGLGRLASRRLARAGCEVLVGCRSEAKARAAAAAAAIAAEAGEEAGGEAGEASPDNSDSSARRGGGADGGTIDSSSNIVMKESFSEYGGGGGGGGGANGTVAAVAAPLELTDTGAVRAFAAHVEQEHGPVDVLVHCAGVFISEGARDTTVINAVAPTLLTALLRPRLRTVSVMTAPKGQAAAPYPSAETLIEGENSDASDAGGMASLRRYIHTKQLFACAMTHLASRGVGGQHVLLGPGAVDTGIHAKLPAGTPRWMRFALWLQSFRFDGTPEWASENIAKAARGEFDSCGGGGGGLVETEGDGSRRVQVVDLGKVLDLDLCHDTARNKELYDALMALAEDGR
jgi:NAD(P)-dependent dehydrogenase (short-subunit alcohol dehydrogenase family)